LTRGTLCKESNTQADLLSKKALFSKKTAVTKTKAWHMRGGHRSARKKVFRHRGWRRRRKTFPLKGECEEGGKDGLREGIGKLFVSRTVLRRTENRVKGRKTS